MLLPWDRGHSVDFDAPGALMKFHSSKMESINKSIKELWNKTYKVRE